MRTFVTTGISCIAIVCVQAQTPVRSVSVVTRLLPKAERSAPDAKAIDTQRAICVVLQPVTAIEAGADGVHRFAGVLESQARRATIAIDWDGSSSRARFGLDVDTDGTLADGELRDVAVRISKAPPGTAAGVARAQFDVPRIVEIGERPYGIQIRRYEDGVVRAELVSDVDYRLGEVDLDGVAHTLLVIDWDDDARFGSAGDVFTFLPSAHFQRSAAFGAARGFTFPITDAALLGDRRARFDGVVGADGVAHLKVGPADEAVADYLRRRRARAVAQVAVALADRAAEFERDNGLRRHEPDKDAARIPWLWQLDATGALAAARAAGKPLFLLYENEADERCAQMDIYTWDDPQVVEAAGAYVCARVTLELDLERSGDAFGVRLGPAYVFCDPQGRPLLYRDRKTGRPVGMSKGFKSPKDMAALLHASAKRIATGAFDPQ